MQDRATLDLSQHNKKLRNSIDVRVHESFHDPQCAAQGRLLSSLAASSILSTYMMPGRIGSKGNSAVTET